MDRKVREKLAAALESYSARDMKLSGVSITIEPHRVNDSTDDEAAWCFKAVVIDAYGDVIETTLL